MMIPDGARLFAVRAIQLFSNSIHSDKARSLAPVTDPSMPQLHKPPKVNLRLVTFGAILMVAASLFLWLDLPIARFARAGHFPGDVRTIFRLAETFSHGYGSLAILLGVWAVTRVHWKRMAPLFAVVYVPGVIVSLFKVSIARRRPNSYVDELPTTVTSTFESVFPFASENWTGFDRAIQSFPSGHTATGFGLAIALSFAFPKGRIYFATLAFLALLQRIDAGAHFPSDTVFSIGLTLVVSAILLRIWPIEPFTARVEDTARYLNSDDVSEFEDSGSRIPRETAAKAPMDAA